MYSDGHGVPRDEAEALKWYRHAAIQGFALAQYNLGRLYLFGQTVPRDEVQAYAWLTLAAAQLPESDQTDAITMLESLMKEMTPLQIAAGQKQAREWRKALPSQ